MSGAAAARCPDRAAIAREDGLTRALHRAFTQPRLQSRGLSERHGLRIVRMSASSLRYQPRPDRNQALRARILALAYVRRRRRKKIPLAERQPLVRPAAANEVWSMDFVFDRIACGRTIKCLVIVDDATHESVAVQPEHSMGGNQLVRFLDQLSEQRGCPAVIRSDNGPEFCGKAMLTWAHRNGITLRPIEPGKPNQNAYVESFNSRLRDECLNVNEFRSLEEARVVLRTWRDDYNHHRPHGSLGKLTPSEFATNGQKTDAEVPKLQL